MSTVTCPECEAEITLEKDTETSESGIRSQGGEPRFVYKTGDSALDHTPNEHISLDEYAKSVDVLVNTLNDLILKTQK